MTNFSAWSSGIITAWGTKVSILFNLLLASIKNLLCFFFLFFVILSNFFIISVVKEKIKVKLAHAIPIGAPTTLTEEIIQLHHLLYLKQLKPYLSNQMQQHICLIFYCMIFFG